MNFIKTLLGKKTTRPAGDSPKVLTQDDNILVRNLGMAFSDVIEGRFTLEEKEIIDKVEAIRTKLLASNDPVKTMSYGAGSRKEKRTEEEMRRGKAGSGIVGVICENTSKPPFWAQILFKTILYSKVQKCLELGTSLGISGLYQASALKLNGSGVFKTMEGSPEVAKLAQRNFESLGLDNVTVVIGSFQETLEPVLKEGNFDYAFIDGHHDRDATIKYFEQIYPGFVSPGLLVFDDIKWNDGMIKAWNVISADKRVAVSIDLGPMGICIIDKSLKTKKHFDISL